MLQRCVDGEILRKDLKPAEVGLILWSSATALMMRIDSEEGIWREAFQLNLHDVLNLSMICCLRQFVRKKEDWN